MGAAAPAIELLLEVLDDRDVVLELLEFVIPFPPYMSSCCIAAACKAIVAGSFPYPPMRINAATC